MQHIPGYIRRLGKKAAEDVSIDIRAEIATTSGTAHDFTGIPAGTKRVTVMFDGVSLSGTDVVLVQLGDAGGIETTGYVGTVASIGTNTDYAGSGFRTVTTSAATNAITGVLQINLMDEANNTWIGWGIVRYTGAANTFFTAGSKSLSERLTQVRITRTGTNTFDAGAVTITVE